MNRLLALIYILAGGRHPEQLPLDEPNPRRRDFANESPADTQRAYFDEFFGGRQPVAWYHTPTSEIPIDVVIAAARERGYKHTGATNPDDYGGRSFTFEKGQGIGTSRWNTGI